MLIPSSTERASEPTSCYYLSKICSCVPAWGLIPARKIVLRQRPVSCFAKVPILAGTSQTTCPNVGYASRQRETMAGPRHVVPLETLLGAIGVAIARARIRPATYNHWGRRVAGPRPCNPRSHSYPVAKSANR